MLDVRSICILSSVLDEYVEVKVRARDRQYASCLLIPWTKSHKDPDVIDFSVPHHAQYLHKAWKRHQNAVYWVDINLAILKGLTFYQTRSNAIILQEHVQLVVFRKLLGWKLEQSKTTKVYMSPRPPPKISMKHDWKNRFRTRSTIRNWAAI